MSKEFNNKFNDDNPVLSFLADAEASSQIMEKIKKIKSRDVSVDELIQVDELKYLFPRDPQVYIKLKEDIDRDGLLSPIIVWKSEKIIVDGNTRFDIIKELGWEKVEVKELEFNSMEEAKKFAEIMQLDRRNFTQAQIFEYANKNLDLKRGQGRDVEVKANTLGISPSSVQHAQFVQKFGNNEQIDLIKSGKENINKVFEQIKQAQYVEKNATEEQKQQIENGVSTVESIFNDIKEAEKEKKEEAKRKKQLEEEENQEKNPNPVIIHQRKEDDTPKFNVPEETELDKWLIEKNRQLETAKMEGFSEGFEKALIFVLSEVIKGKRPEEIYNDERISDLSPTVISKFELPSDAEDIVERL